MKVLKWRCRKGDEGITMIWARQVRRIFVRRRVTGQKKHAVQLDGAGDRLGDFYMSPVDWVKRSAEETDPTFFHALM